MIKLTSLLFFIFIETISFSQIKTTYYDYKWDSCEISKARFVSIVEKTDSGWLRKDYFISTQKLQMQALYKDNTCTMNNGYAYYFYPNGNLETCGNYINDSLDGMHIHYHYNNMIADSGYYKNDDIVGYKLGWHSNGVLADSIEKKNDSTYALVQWFDNGSISEYGYLINDKKNGKWNYFHKNGNLAAIEINNQNKIDSVTFFDEDGKIQLDTSHVNMEASFIGGPAKWKEYIHKKIYWPAGHYFNITKKVTVVVAFTVNEDGKIENSFIRVPVQPVFDKIALEAVNESPLWKPAYDHNRRIKKNYLQAITFKMPHQWSFNGNPLF